jgi:CheY-like chemotaxis protein
MPGLDGYQLCSRLRSQKKNKDIKILFISGNIAPKESDRIKEAGADGYLEKPFSNKELKTKISGLFGWDRRVEDK